MTNKVYNSIIRMLQTKRFGEAEDAAICLVKQEPLNPQSWVFLAETLLHQGYIETAGKAFERAWLLDPEADWAESVYAMLAVLKDRAPRFDIENLLNLPKVTVSAVIIVEDDGPAFRQCIASLGQAVDEVVVVNRGSTSATHSFTIHHPNLKLQYLTDRGEEGLASAKNRALQLVTSKWVIFVRANEYLFRQDQPAFREIVSLYNRVYPPVILKAGRELAHPHEASSPTFEEARLFPTGYGLHFWGEVHPQIGDEDGPFGENTVQRSVRLRFGYQEKNPPTDEQIAIMKQQQAQQLLLAAKENLLISKQLCVTYRGLAKVDKQILTWKADRLLAEIATYNEGDR